MVMKRQALVERNTGETQIRLELTITDGVPGKYTGSCGIGFLDHMLSAVCVHGGMDIKLEMSGDLGVDCHHSVEDLGIVFGRAFGRAAGDKSGICRYGEAYVPMDESLARTVLDISGRPYLVFSCDWKNERVGALDLCMIKEFFYAFSYSSGVTLHMQLLYGDNDHHKAEALFKSFARALAAAAAPRSGGILSTKGTLC